MWFKRDEAYDRFSTLTAADRAVAKGRSRRAIALYGKVLAVDPADHVTHGKVAPLLAKRRKQAEAWASFVAAGEGYLREDRFDRALSIYAQAARYLPRRLEAWEAIARLQCELGHPADGVQALLDGCRHFRGRKRRCRWAGRRRACARCRGCGRSLARARRSCHSSCRTTRTARAVRCPPSRRRPTRRRSRSSRCSGASRPEVSGTRSSP